MVKVGMLKAFEGDFIWLSYGEEKAESHILIDGGTAECGEKYADIVNYIASRKEKIEAIILTHIDCDHIGGACAGISKVTPEILQGTIKRIFFNTCCDGINEIRVAASQGGYGVGEAVTLLELFKQKGLKERLIERSIAGDCVELDGGAQLKFISPGERELDTLEEKWESYLKKNEPIAYLSNLDQVNTNLDEMMKIKMRSDSSVNNAASLAFIFEYLDVKGAFLGDAKPSVCLKGLKTLMITEPYNIDFLKLSHHGSMGNTNSVLLRKFNTKNYLLSTNGNQRKTPQKAVVSQLLKNCINMNKDHISLFCNYDWWETTFSNQFFTKYDNIKYIDTGKLRLCVLETEPLNIRDGLVFYGKGRF